MTIKLDHTESRAAGVDPHCYMAEIRRRMARSAERFEDLNPHGKRALDCRPKGSQSDFTEALNGLHLQMCVDAYAAGMAAGRGEKS